MVFLVPRKFSKELRLSAKDKLACVHRLVNAKFSESKQVLAKKSGFYLLQDLCELILALSDSLPLTVFLKFSIVRVCSLNCSIPYYCFSMFVFSLINRTTHVMVGMIIATSLDCFYNLLRSFRTARSMEKTHITLKEGGNGGSPRYMACGPTDSYNSIASMISCSENH